MCDNGKCKHHHIINKSSESNSNGLPGFTPEQLITAYDVPSYVGISDNEATVTIIIGYHYPNLQQDFDVYCQTFNLPYQKLNIISFGTEEDPESARETCLDVQMVHAINPNAQITVIESVSFDDINNAVILASTGKIVSNGVTYTTPIAQVISMSYGVKEYYGVNDDDSIIYSNPNICYCASSGDDNYFLCYPSNSQNVIAVGGTSLKLNKDNTRKFETTWTDAGCGISKYVKMPNYQSGCRNIPKVNRITPDISLVANPNTGVCVYYNGQFEEIGGTSASCPIFAAMLSIANQKRLDINKPILTSVATATENMVQQYMYKTIYYNRASYIKNFYDIIGGNDGKYVAIPYFDFATGLGSPKSASVLINSLVNA
jgi:subtilase family serine protease